MKKWLCMVLCAGMMFGTAACGGGAEETSAETQQAEQMEETNTAEETETDTRGIEGSDYELITSMLEMTGFPKGEINQADDGHSYFSVMEKDYAGGIKQAYTLSFDSDNEIMELCLLTSNMELINESTFLESAQIFFTYAALVSYDTSDSEKVKTWLNEAIQNLSEEGESIVVGDAEFTVSCERVSSGAIGVVTLDMQKVTK